MEQADVETAGATARLTRMEGRIVRIEKDSFGVVSVPGRPTVFFTEKTRVRLPHGMPSARFLVVGREVAVTFPDEPGRDLPATLLEPCPSP